ncbi:thiamine pyrophosphate-binding protein [Thiolapillus brandeum]|uniref:Acetolactate synthase I/II/III large subunit n=1 Tax=Thiolapillus brandeum TaxID=1076588 RepID=A0A7U6GJ93_9GAMM|nr:thiamine pyrophosphate-binding protein [Thiolapillus brandeum]BAO44701.1 acetolactate synthase I/II/III large subunit [Thiolapillus brandeum]
MTSTVAELIVSYMERLGIRHIFGMPGAHILPVYDALYDSDIQSVLAKHEQGASFMAGGYARASGGIGACITTAGPGATNLVTGIANAYADRQPVLAITGETSTHIFGRGGLQESSGEGGSIDQIALFQGITRYNRIVERTDYLGNVLNRASRILLADNPGPVLLSLPFNVQKEKVDEAVLEDVMTRAHVQTHEPSCANAEDIVDMLLKARHPVIVAGYGCLRADAQEPLGRLSRWLNIPVASSLKAKGVVDESSGLSLGSLGVSSSGKAYRHIVEQADLVMVLGAAFNERTSYVWDRELLNGRKVIQIDVNPEQLEKVFKADLAIQGDVRKILDDVLRHLETRGVAQAGEPGLEAGEGGDSGRGYEVFQSGFALVEKFFRELEQHFADDAVVFDDNIIFAQNFYRVSSRARYYPNSGISSLGHAIPAAIGAQFHEPAPCFAVLGDGGFQMCCMEIMTAVNYHRPLNILLFNNATMGLIRKNQHQQYEQRFIDCDFINPDYAKLADSFGINHVFVDTEAAVEQLFRETDLVRGINLIEMPIDRNSFPNYSSRR